MNTDTDHPSVPAESEALPVGELAAMLVSHIARLNSAIVAFSAGVDSTVVAAAARKGLGRENLLAVTSCGPSLPSGEKELAGRIAVELDMPIAFVEAGEQQDPRYIRNGGDRCYWCKSSLYQAIRQTFSQPWPILNGTNADDLGDYRPGLQAATEFQVVSPLAELSITKKRVREIAGYWGLAVADKPAGPCLASRLAHGVQVTPARLAAIDRAESLLRRAGFETVRVRLHPGEIARIEVPPERIVEACEWLVSGENPIRIQELGFRFVTLDSAGFRSGSLNRLIPPEELFSIGRNPKP